jgi:hypothetical protein
MPSLADPNSRRSRVRENDADSDAISQCGGDFYERNQIERYAYPIYKLVLRTIGA